MASEFKEFLTTLEPVWEDPHEFDWLKEIKIKKNYNKQSYDCGF